MTRELLEKRLAEIDRHLEQALANYNVLLGGKQELQYWLTQLDAKPATDNALLTAIDC